MHFPGESGKIDRLPRTSRGMLGYVGGDTCDHYLGVSEVSGKCDVGEGDTMSKALSDCVRMGKDVLNVAVLVTVGTFFVVYSSIDAINATLPPPCPATGWWYWYQKSLEAKDDLISSALSQPMDLQGIEGVKGFVKAVDSVPHFCICHAAHDVLGTMSEPYNPGLRCVSTGGGLL